MMKNLMSALLIAGLVVSAPLAAHAGPKGKKANASAYKKAKAQCKKENPGLSKQELKDCIRDKRNA
jgi:hypothetical protein